MELSQQDLKFFNGSIKEFISNLERDVDDALSACGRDYANKVRAEIGVHDPFVNVNVYGEFWRKLSNNWIHTKASLGKSLEMWSATGGIYRSIRIHNLPMEVFSGINSEQDPDAFQSAIHNEFGTTWVNTRVPARPLFMPVANIMTEEFRAGDGVYKYIVDAFNLSIKRTW